MNTPCEHYTSMMPDLVSGPLDTESRARLLRHLENCADCRQRHALLSGDDERLTAFAEGMRPVVSRITAATLRSLHQGTGLPPAAQAQPTSQGRRHGLLTRPLRVAAVVAIACLGVIAGLQFLGRFEVATVSLARTLETMRGMSWIHVVEISATQPAATREYWESAAPHIVAWRTSDGQVQYADYAHSTAYHYNPGSNKITVGLTTDNYMPAPPASPFEMLTQIMNSAAEQGAQILRQPVAGTGGRREQIQITLEGHPHYRATTLIRDPRLDVLVRIETVLAKGENEYFFTSLLDYPAVGPSDIYALGVPQDALVWDTRPDGPARQLVDAVQSRFERGLGDYRAVILDSWRGADGTLSPCGISVLRQQGVRKRSDQYYAFNFQSAPGTPATLYSLIKDLWPNLTIPQALALESEAVRERQMLFDGHQTLMRSRVGGRLTTRTHPSDQFQMPQAGPAIDSLTGLIWPNLHLEMQSSSSHNRKQVRLLTADPNYPGLIGLRSIGFAETDEWWFDPNKDYMLVAKTSIKAGASTAIYVVVQSAQTASGRWYPKEIHTEFTRTVPQGESQTSRTAQHVLLELEPTFEEGVFDAAGLGR